MSLEKMHGKGAKEWMQPKSKEAREFARDRKDGLCKECAKGNQQKRNAERKTKASQTRSLTCCVCSNILTNIQHLTANQINNARSQKAEKVVCKNCFQAGCTARNPKKYVCSRCKQDKGSMCFPEHVRKNLWRKRKHVCVECKDKV